VYGETRYAKSSDAHIAFQARGDGPIDIVYVPQLGAGDVESRWEQTTVDSLEASAGGTARGTVAQQLTRFARVIMFDKRGTGLSGRVLDVPTFEQQIDDVVAVMDAARSTQAVMLGVFDGAALAALFAAIYPQRTRALVTWMLVPRVLRAADYPWGIDAATWDRWIGEAHAGVGLQDLRQQMNPGRVDDAASQRALDRRIRLYAGPGGSSAFMRMWAGIDIRPVLPTIRVPTLVLQRADAVLVPAEVGRYVAHTIEGARYVELAGTAIAIGSEDSDRLADEIEEFITGTPPLRAPDRVLATILFTDIVDSTARSAELGDRRWRSLLASHDGIVRQQLAHHRGLEVKTMGDAFLVRFDGPGRAVQCARAIRDALHAIDLEIRAGLHTGEIELVNDDISGIAVTIGKRIESIAHPGEVLVSRTVVDLVAGSGIEFVDRGEHKLKGVPGNWQLFAVAG
jgi:class 3 adenylate cyclase